MKKILSIAALGLFLCIGKVFAQDAAAQGAISVSVSPLSALDMALNRDGQPLEYLRLEFDINYLADNNVERSVGAIIKFTYPNLYALRYQQRKFSGDNHTGFLHGFYGRIEYREMNWGYDDGKVEVSTSWFSNGTGTMFRSIGATFGGDVGFRLRGERFGATFYAGAGLPLFYCFGDIPKDQLASFYLSSALIRVLNLGIKLDFYL
jgi:hypothetical protein